MNSYLAIKFCIQYYNNMHKKILCMENVRTSHLPDIAINITQTIPDKISGTKTSISVMWKNMQMTHFKLYFLTPTPPPITMLGLILLNNTTRTFEVQMFHIQHCIGGRGGLSLPIYQFFTICATYFVRDCLIYVFKHIC